MNKSKSDILDILLKINILEYFRDIDIDLITLAFVYKNDNNNLRKIINFSKLQKLYDLNLFKKDNGTLAYYGDTVLYFITNDIIKDSLQLSVGNDVLNMISEKLINNKTLTELSFKIFICDDFYDIHTTNLPEHNSCSDSIEAILGALYIQYGLDSLNRIKEWFMSLEQINTYIYNIIFEYSKFSIPSKSNINIQSSIPSKSNINRQSSIPGKSSINRQSSIPSKSSINRQSSIPNKSSIPSKSSITRNPSALSETFTSSKFSTQNNIPITPTIVNEPIIPKLRYKLDLDKIIKEKDVDYYTNEEKIIYTRLGDSPKAMLDSFITSYTIFYPYMKFINVCDDYDKCEMILKNTKTDIEYLLLSYDRNTKYYHDVITVLKDRGIWKE